MRMISDTSVPDVPAEQKAFDQAHKHLCKLRWIGQHVDSEYAFEILRAAGLASRPRKPRMHFLPAPRERPDRVTRRCRALVLKISGS
jgi:hypothetical protein